MPTLATKSKSKRLAAFVIAVVLIAGGFVGITTAPAFAGSQSFTADGTFTVPAGVTDIQITATGAQGGVGSFGGTAGRGGRTVANLSVAPAQVLHIFVGGVGGNGVGLTGGVAGSNGGGAGGGSMNDDSGGGGGGASDVRTTPALADRVIVAAGGGGAGGNSTGGSGGQTGTSGTSSGGGGNPGGGGTSGAGGAGGSPTAGDATVGAPGVLGQGGTGGTGATVVGLPPGGGGGGGGGGGYYGGGGGGGWRGYFGGSGGGGSSFAGFGTSSVVFTSGVGSGSGSVDITWADPHTVTFDSNGGSGSMSPQVANVPTALTAGTFTRAGFSFTGWNTAAGGGGTAYADGAVYSFTADTTLYAQWAPLPGPLTFSSGAFHATTVGTPADLTVTVTNTGTAASTPSAITRAGTGVVIAGTSSCATGTPITVGGTCTVDLVWTPAAPGPLTGSLTIAYPGGTSASDTLTLSGTATAAPVPVLTQSPLDGCVRTGGVIARAGTKQLASPGCITNALQRVGVRVAAQQRLAARGDAIYYTLFCQVSKKMTTATKATGYADGSSYCKKGELRIRTYGYKLKLRITWSAPATGNFAAYTKTKTYRT